jgi:hypothetical protein
MATGSPSADQGARARQEPARRARIRGDAPVQTRDGAADDACASVGDAP